MQDFIRIGGPVTSSPLNENFRRLLNAISIANTNLVFPEDDGTVSTIEEMEKLKESGKLIDGQVCYVVSSGEFYRYSAGDDKWHKIMDIGQTFRQGFLNSGLVIMNGDMEVNARGILVHDSLIYFKNQPGDGRYLKGMYLIPETTVELSGGIADGAYSILVDKDANFTIISGMPSTDDPDHVFLGSFIVSGMALANVYTLPDIAYTADRGHFFIDGGQAVGLNLIAASGANVGRASGFYYDEGINYSIGTTDEFPATVDNGSNFNLKSFGAVSTVGTLYYIHSTNTFNRGITTSTNGLIYNRYSNNGTIAEVPNGHFTIQRHLVTPKGEDFILFGDEYYNSMTDALAHINDPFGLEADFPYAEATRLVVGTDASGNFDVTNPDLFRVITLSRLAQVGTFTPEFADNQFKIYSSKEEDTTPAVMRFNLRNLDDTNYSGTEFNLFPSALARTKYNFALDKKFVGLNIPDITVVPSQSVNRTKFNLDGYELADVADLGDLRSRVEDIEKEIWQVYQDNKELYQQSLKYRLSKDEQSIDNLLVNLAKKVNKATTINGKTLGDDNTKENEAKAVILYTDDIDEDSSPEHLWFTATERGNLSTAYAHSQKKGRGTATDGNPHCATTDDITALNNSNKQYVTLDQLSKINNLPADTQSAINAKADPITVYSIEGNPLNIGAVTEIGTMNNLYVYEDGANVTRQGNDIILECVGQLTPENVLTKAEFAQHAQSQPGLYYGIVDRALVADGVSILNNAQPAQYYGTNAVGTPGVFDLPVYVSTASAEEYQDVKESVFLPIDKSVTLAHLANSKVTYPVRSEEAKTNTNVYDLVTKHYHKVYNSGVQGPYIDGTQTQDTSEIYYEYKVPAGGLNAGTYYYSYNNANYEFALLTSVSANKVLKYVPSTDVLSLDGTEITKSAVIAEAVDENKWLSFNPVTDWNKINEWNFGNNLTVSVTNGVATINADVAGSGVANFVNLADVNVKYADEHIGKMIVLNKVNGQYRLTWGVANMNNIMNMPDYVGPEATQYVHLADYATSSGSANTLQNQYTVNDGTASATTLWSSSRVVQEINKGVKVYSGTTTPSSSLGKDGDLYILLDE